MEYPNDHSKKRERVIVEFVVGRKSSGEFIRSEFEARVHFNIPPLKFIHGANPPGHNIAEILKALNAVNTARLVYLKGQTPIPIGRSTAFLDATVLLFNRGDRVHRVVWFTRTETPEKVGLEQIAEHLLSLQPIITGTVRSILPELKEQIREKIRSQAEHQARSMLNNARDILTYLQRPSDPASD